MAGLSLFQALLSILSGIVVALASGYVSQVREDQRWLKGEVYRPLFHEVAQAADGNLPGKNRYSSKWESFDRYQKYRVDSSLKKSLERYTECLEQLNEQELDVQNRERFAKSLPEEMVEWGSPGITLVFKNGSPKRVGFDSWLSDYAEDIRPASTPEELRRAMIEKPDLSSLIHEGDVEMWDEQVPEWPEILWESLHNEEYGINEDVRRYGRLKKEKVPDLAEELKTELEERMNVGLFRELFARISRSHC